MEKYSARGKPCCQRLLILLLFAVLPMLYAEIHVPLTDTIEITVHNDILSIDDELEIETIVYHSADRNQNSGYVPPIRFILEENDEYSERVKSIRTADNERTLINSVYRLKKIGTISFSGAFVDIGSEKKRLPPFTVTVHAPPLSEKTVFSWKISGLEGKTYLNENEPIIQGQSYLLFLTADFLVLNEVDTNELHTAMSNFGEQKADRFWYQLPAKLSMIDCPAPENAAVESFVPNSSVSFPQNNCGRMQHILAIFKWTPFFSGSQLFPEAKIQFKSGQTVVSAPYVRMIQEKILGSVKKPVVADENHPAFSTLQPVVQQVSEFEKTAAMIAVARLIAKYRRQELYSLFSGKVRAERKKLEISLGLTAVSSLYPLIFWRVAAVVTLVFLLLLLIFLRQKKTALSLLVFAATVGCGITAVNLFRDARYIKGICATDPSCAVVRHIPELTGSSVSRLIIGEEVYILTEIPQWYFVKTQNGITGWIPQTALVVYTNFQE